MIRGVIKLRSKCKGFEVGYNLTSHATTVFRANKIVVFTNLLSRLTNVHKHTKTFCKYKEPRPRDTVIIKSNQKIMLQVVKI